MSDPNKKRAPILYKGEVYTRPVLKKIGGSRKEPGVSFEEARRKALSGLKDTREKMRAIPVTERAPNEFVFCLRLSPEFSAKSYYPTSLFDASPTRDGLEEIGSRLWRRERMIGKTKSTDTGKLFFVRTTDKGLEKLERKLGTSEEKLTDAFTYDVRKIEAIDTLDSSEQILGVPQDWSEGRLEAVLHPFALDKDVVIDQFLSLANKAGIDSSMVRYKQYESGVTFVSLWGNRKTLDVLAGYNPLRTAHPLSLRDFPIATRSNIVSGAPLPPDSQERSSVIVGIFDGGLRDHNPYVGPYASAEELSTLPAEDFLLDHGTQVTGLVLYGALNQYPSGSKLPHPNLYVKNFRVLPASSTKGPDPYEIIDEIEKTVPANKDIKVYNLSFGPVGPILDDHISRFTFACDLLAVKEEVLFCSAVGNDGQKNPDYLRRIQSPSDGANGLGVGAYTKRDGKVIKAPYSCVGPGREGNKLKPDLLAFGGCDQSPIHLVGNNAGEKIMSSGGTSFSTPIVSRYAAHLIGYSKGAISPLTGRAMLIHTAISEKKDGHSNDFGHGILTDNLSDIVTSPLNAYTLIYQSELLPGKYAEFKIPWVEGIPRGKVTFRWTAAVLTAVDPHSPDDYTTSSVVVTFYPNSNKYDFVKVNAAGKKEHKRLDVKADAALIQKLESDGWEKGPFPVSDYGPLPFASEDELRKEMKWDSVDCRLITKRISGVADPIFHVHALSRGHRFLNKKVKFSIILSVELSEASVDLYSQVLARFSALAPIELRLAADVQAQVNVE